MAVVKTLEHFGCSVDFPQAQTCCGQPQFNNGYPQEARPLAERMIRDHYPELFKDDPAKHQEALDFAARCYEFVEFLTRVLKVDVSKLTLPDPQRFTYHYTCHLRGLGTTGEPCISLLKQLKGASFIPLEKAEQCCGFGGTFAVKYPDISGAIVRDKVQCGQKTGADVMIVNDGGCAMNIGGACHRQHGDFAVKHIAEVLASAIDAGESR